jgi:MoaA/NifB/PqqE/SkfB family radical SAM enzyme
VVEREPVLQIEVTSRCALRCCFCPTHLLGKQWIHGDLPWEVYRDQIAPHLARFALVYLQGWGEPLLHPQLWEMVRLAKAAGCQVGFTTCGHLLDESNRARVLDEGIDILSVSFAGASQTIHESLRVGSDYRRLVANVEALARRRAGANHRTLQLELHFLMLRANLHELPAFVRLAAALGADQVVATNLTCTPTPETEAMRVFAETPDPSDQALVTESEQEAQRLNVQFRAYPLTMDRNTLECDARPTEFVFVNHLGSVAPCVYLGMPVRQDAPRYFRGQAQTVAPIDFGNVRDGLNRAMQSAARTKFVRAFQARKAGAFSAAALLAVNGDGAMRLPEPPPPCRACYKMYGV